MTWKYFPTPLPFRAGVQATPEGVAGESMGAGLDGHPLAVGFLRVRLSPSEGGQFEKERG